MMHRATICFAGLLAACSVSMEIPEAAQIRCTADGDCPTGYRCSGESLCVDPDANQAPRLLLSSAGAAGEGRAINQVHLPFSVNDPNGPPLGADTVSVVFEWSVAEADGSFNTWHPATAHADSSPLTDMGDTQGLVFVWDLLADATGTGLPVSLLDNGTTTENVVGYLPMLQIRGMAQDAAGLTSGWVHSDTFAAGDSPPTAELLAWPDRLAGAVPIGLRLADAAADAASVEVEFRLHSADSWRAMEIVLGTARGLLAPPDGVETVLVWDSTAPVQTDPDLEQGIGDQTLDTVQLRFRTSNSPQPGLTHYGEWSAPLDLPEIRNQTPPYIAELQVPRANLGGGSSPIAVLYRVVDEQSDPVDASFEYSVDSGSTWRSCVTYIAPQNEGRTGLLTAPAAEGTSGGVWHAFLWDSTGVVFSPVETTSLRVTVADQAGQSSSATTGLGFPIGPTEQGESFDVFAPYAAVAAGAFAHSHAVADVDEDDVLDIVVGLDYEVYSPGDERILVLLGNGDGSFAATTGLATDYGVTDVLLIDLDGNEHLDVVALEFNSDTDSPNYSATQISVFFGAGDGSFSAPTSSSGPDWAQTIRLGLIDDDENYDVVTNAAGSVGFMRGNGDGTFAAAVSYGNRGNWLGSFDAVIIDHLDGDEHLDVAATVVGDNSVRILVGDGTGAFSDGGLLPVGEQPSGAVAADLDLDGDLDLAISNFATNDVTVLLAAGDGTFAEGVAYTAGLEPRGVAAADINQDGVLDLLVTNEGSESVGVLIGLASGEFASPAFFQTGDAPVGVTYVDLDGDGIGDLLTGATNGYNSDIYVLMGNAEISLGSLGSPAPVAGAAVSNSVLLQDFDADGVLDLAINEPQPLTRRGVGRHGIGTGRFGEEEPVEPDVASIGINNLHAAAGDFNGDGRTDLVISWSSEVFQRFLTFYVGTGSGVVGDGGFRIAGEVEVSGYPDRLLVEDFDQNGLDDVAFAFYGSAGPGNYLAVTRVEGVEPGGDLSFFPVENHLLGAYHSGITAADFDNDGWVDVAVASISQSSGYVGYDYYGVHVLLNEYDQGGTFAAPQLHMGAERNYSLCAADFDEDGRMDIAVSQNRRRNRANTDWVPAAEEARVEILLGQGNGTFVYTPEFYTPNSDDERDELLDVVCADFNGDGAQDFVMSNPSKSEVVMFVGAGDGTFQLADNFAAGTGVGQLAVADLNKDGLLDLATSSPTVLSGQLERRIGTWARRLVPFVAADLATLSASSIFLFGGATVDETPNLFGEPAVDGVLQQRLWPATGDWFDALDRRLSQAGHVVAETARLAGYPYDVSSTLRWQRQAFDTPAGPARRVCVVDTGYDLSNGTSSGLVITLPLLPALTPAEMNDVRLFRRSEDWLRIAQVPEDALFDTPEAAECLPRSGDRDIVVSSYTWDEISRDGDNDLSTGTGERFLVETDDPPTMRVLVERTGVFQALVE